MSWRSPSRDWQQLTPFLPARSRLRLAWISITSFGGGLAESLILVLVTLSADSLIRGTTSVEVAGRSFSRSTAIVVALVLVVGRVVLLVLASRAASQFAAAIMHSAQTSAALAFLQTSHAARSNQNVGDLAAVVVTHGRFTGDLANAFIMMTTAACALVAFGGTSLAVNPLATLGIAATGGLLLLVMRPLRRATKSAADQFVEVGRRLSVTMTETELLHREIEVFRVADPVRARVQGELDAAATNYARLRFLGAITPQVFQAAMLAVGVLSLLVVAQGNRQAELGAVGAVVLLLLRSMTAAQQLVMSSQRIVEFGSYAKGLNENIASLDAARPNRGDRRPASLLPIRLEDVSFTYDGEVPVLTHVNTTISGGDVVGIVGPSGAGKSTLVDLLLDLRAPTEGRITCAGVPLQEIGADYLSERLALVPQTPNLIRGTVVENVAFFRSIGEGEVRNALDRAHLTAEISLLPRDLQTRLGPTDRALSGGQRQRLTIARALAGAPQLLVLDEPTSALDAVSENAIRETLAEIPGDMAVVIVAHRYSTLRTCNRILVVRDGRIEADAAPDEVARDSAYFRAMLAEPSAAQTANDDAPTGCSHRMPPLPRSRPDGRRP